MDVVHEIEQFILSLATLLREIERNMHNPNVAVLENVSRRLEGSLGLLQVVRSCLSELSSSPDQMEDLRRLALILEHSQGACNGARVRSSVELRLCDAAVTVHSQETPGRPPIWLPRETLEFCESMRLPWSQVARNLGISTRTLLRRRHEYAMAIGASRFDEISDPELDQIVDNCLQATPNAGGTYIRGSVADRGWRIQRDRIRDSLGRVDPVSRSLRRTRTIFRRQYSVPGPNALW